MSAPSHEGPSAPGERSSSERFQALFDEFAPALYTWTSLRIRPSMRARVDPQDVMQEVWLRALSAFPTFDPARGSFRAWLLGIGKNVLLEALDRMSNDRLLLGGGASSRLFRLESCPDSVTSASARLARDDTIRRFLEFVGTLEPADRRIVIHCGCEELTCADTAVRLGLSSDAVIKRWQRLRARMRESGWDRLLTEVER